MPDCPPSSVPLEIFIELFSRFIDAILQGNNENERGAVRFYFEFIHYVCCLRLTHHWASSCALLHFRPFGGKFHPEPASSGCDALWSRTADVLPKRRPVPTTLLLRDGCWAVNASEAGHRKVFR